MPRLRATLILLAVYLLWAGTVSAQTTQPVDRVFVLQAGGAWIEFQPKDASFVPVNLPVFGLAFDRTGSGKYTGEWVPVARPTTQPATQPTTRPADVGSLPPPVIVKPPGIHVASGESITAALKAAGSGTVVYLAAGGVYNEGVTDTSLRLRSVTLAAWGNGAKPLVKVPNGSALVLYRPTDVTVTGIEFASDKPTAAGIRIFGGERVKLDGINVHDFVFGVTCEPYATNRASQFTLTRSEVWGNYSPKNKGDSSGVFVSGTDGVEITNNYIHDNGWREGESAGTDRNHNLYAVADVTGFVLKDNVIARGASWNAQVRCGGEVEGNTFVDAPAHLSFGYVNGAGPIAIGGVSGKVNNNTFIGERLMAGQHRGTALVFGNCKPGAVECVGNIFANDNPPNPNRGVNQAAIRTDIGILSDDNPHRGKDVRVTDLVIKDNKGVWPGGIFKNNVARFNPINVQKTFEPVDVQQVRAAALAKVGG